MVEIVFNGVQEVKVADVTYTNDTQKCVCTITEADNKYTITECILKITDDDLVITKYANNLKCDRLGNTDGIIKRVATAFIDDKDKPKAKAKKTDKKVEVQEDKKATTKSKATVKGKGKKAKGKKKEE